MTVQGFGNVGSHASMILSRLGVSTIAVGDHTGYMLNPEGFNAHKLQDYVEEARLDRRLPGRQGDHARGVLRDEGRHLRPGALENQIGETEAKALNVQARRRRRQRPDRAGRRADPAERGIDILPDVLANSGGVTVSYYEWVQNKRSESWTGRGRRPAGKRDEARVPRGQRLRAAKKCDLRMAAMGIALQRISKAYSERGIFP